MISLGQIKKYIPFTYEFLLKNSIRGGVKTILDIGCGDGELMEVINSDKRYSVVGVDMYKSSLKIARKRKVYKRLKMMDITDLKFRPKSFDAVICSMAVEHLTKIEGLKLIKDIESIAKKRVIISTTVGFFPFKSLGGDSENPFQIHKSGWQPGEFRKRGYRVLGQGADFVYGKKRLIFLLSGNLKYLLFILSYIFSPFYYLFPEKSAYMLCIKNTS